jgi:UrcA family protein
MKNFTAVVALAMGAAAPVGPSWAGAAPDTLSEIVRFADLDANSPAGVTSLYKRLNGAARRVCSDWQPWRVLTRAQSYEACVHTALDKALADVGRPALIDYASRKTACAKTIPRVEQSK